jgi:iron complex transport system substrate-binding protein
MRNKRLNPFLGLLWITITATLLLVACGDNTATSVPATTAAATTAATTAAQTTAAATTAPATTAAATTAASTGTHVVKHAMGETTVPNNPQRVVVLDSGELDTAITLGIKPVGAASAGGDTFVSYLKDKTEGITNIGMVSQPNLEKIASLKPDLILGNKFRHEAFYKQLSQIAPTVFADNVGPTWKEISRFMLTRWVKPPKGPPSWPLTINAWPNSRRRWATN